MEIEVNGKKYVAVGPSGYELLVFTEKYFDDRGKMRRDISKAEMIVDLIHLIFKVDKDEIKKLRWSELNKLNNAASEYLNKLLQGETEKN